MLSVLRLACAWAMAVTMRMPLIIVLPHIHHQRSVREFGWRVWNGQGQLRIEPGEAQGLAAIGYLEWSERLWRRFFPSQDKGRARASNGAWVEGHFSPFVEHAIQPSAAAVSTSFPARDGLTVKPNGIGEQLQFLAGGAEGPLGRTDGTD